STPRNPPSRPVTPAWNSTTEPTAKARNPSRAGLYPNEVAACGPVFGGAILVDMALACYPDLGEVNEAGQEVLIGSKRLLCFDVPSVRVDDQLPAPPADRADHRTALLAAVAALVTVVFWASAFVAIRHVGHDFGPGPMALGRLLAGSVV